MKSRAILIASVLVAAGFASGAGAQSFASYGAYLPTHPEVSEAGYWYMSHGPVYAEPRFGSAPDYNAEFPGRSGWRRGQYLPPDYRAEAVDDYASVGLRRPPRGYAWYRDADDYILAAARSGRIASVINGAD